MASNFCHNSKPVLPPQVNGKLCGYITVTVGNVFFREKPKRNVGISIIWWGENEPTLLRSSDSTSLSNHLMKLSASYEVRTSRLQFQKYLKDSESLKIEIFDEDNAENIGFITLLDLWFMLQNCPYKSYFPIINLHNKCIGELNVEFNIRFFENQLPNAFKYMHEESDRFANLDLPLTKGNNGLQNCKHSGISHTNFNYPVKTNRELVSRLPNTISSSKTTKNSCNSEHCTDSGIEIHSTDYVSEINLSNRSGNKMDVMDYLLGKNMSTMEEKNTLDFLEHWPELESVSNVISDLSENKDPYLIETQNKSGGEVVSIQQADKSDNINSLPSLGFHVFLKVISLELTFLDASATCKSSISSCPKSSVTYFVEYKFPTPVKDNCRPWKEPLQGIRMSSRKQVGSVVFFNQSSIHHLSTHSKVMEEQLASSINFRIYSRDFNQRTPTLIGVSQVLLSELIPDNVQSSELRKLSIFSSNLYHRKCKGMLILRIKWVNIATKLKHDSDYQYQKPKRTLVDGDCDDICLGSTNKKAQMNNKSLKEDFDSEKRLENRLISSIKVPLLHVLVSISEAYYCLMKPSSLVIKKNKTFNMYLVYRTFWNKGATSKSQIFWNTNNPNFEFSEVHPLLLTPHFIEMCQNNFMVVELWDRQIGSGKDNLLGIAKVPIHQFYLAYKDHSVIDDLIKLESPVISMDGNVRVFSPMDPSKICGWIHVLLAIGTQEQVYNLRKSHSMSLLSHSANKEISKKYPYSYLQFHDLSNDKNKSEIINTNKSEVLIKSRSSFDCTNDKLLRLKSPIEKDLYIDELREFVPFLEKSALENTDCYIECKLPLPNIQETIKTLVKPVHSVVKFYSPLVSLKYTEDSIGEIIFKVWCRSYRPNIPPIDRMVAQAKLPLQRLSLGISNCSDRVLNQNFSLPLISVETSNHNGNQSKGFLFLRIMDKVENKYINSPENAFLYPTKEKEKTSDLENELSVKRNQESQTEDSYYHSNDLRPASDNNPLRTNGKNESRPTNDSNKSCNLSEYEPTESSEIANSCILGEDKEISDKGSEESCINPCSTTLKEGFYQVVANNKTLLTDLFKVHIEIERAIHLNSEYLIHSTYVTFWSYNKEQLWITPNVSTGSNPVWNWHCDTYLDGELLTKRSKSLILQVWIIKEANGKPDPLKDISLGLVSIDASVLIYGMPQISGWFNIFNSDHSCKGQIKVTITPMEDLSKFRLINMKRSFVRPLKYEDKCKSSVIKHTELLNDHDKVCKTQVPKRIPDEIVVRDKIFVNHEKTDEELCKSGSAKNDLRESPNNASQILKSKIDELDGMLMKWKDTFGIESSLNEKVADVEIYKSQSNAYGKFSDSASSSEDLPASISSNISRNFSKVNPSTDLKILEKYMSELVCGINMHNSENSPYVSPEIEELFYQCNNNGIESLGKETFEELESNDKNPETLENILTTEISLEIKEDQCHSQMYNSEQIVNTILDEACKNSAVTGKSSKSKVFHSSSINVSSVNNNCEGKCELEENIEDEEQTLAWIEGLEALINDGENDDQQEVPDVPRQAPEGGNPREDESSQAQLTNSQNKLPDPSQTECKDSDSDESISMNEKLFKDLEIQRISKIFNTTFTKN